MRRPPRTALERRVLREKTPVTLKIAPGGGSFVSSQRIDRSGLLAALHKLAEREQLGCDFQFVPVSCEALKNAAAVEDFGFDPIDRECQSERIVLRFLVLLHADYG